MLLRLKESCEYILAKGGLIGGAARQDLADRIARINRILEPEDIGALVAETTEAINTLADLRPESYGDARIVDDSNVAA